MISAQHEHFVACDGSYKIFGPKYSHQGSFKKCLLLFGQTEMVLVAVWLLDPFRLKSAPSVNGVWIIIFVSHLHIWVTKFKS